MRLCLDLSRPTEGTSRFSNPVTGLNNPEAVTRLARVEMLMNPPWTLVLLLEFTTLPTTNCRSSVAEEDCMEN
jgi:hypothetical protein